MYILGLDILVNNAARIYFPDSTEPYEIQARNTIETNYYGNKWVGILYFVTTILIFYQTKNLNRLDLIR